MKIRFIKTKAFNAHMNMALDEIISAKVREGKALPTVRIYTWEPSAVSIGYFQGLHNEINVQACEEQGIDIVRRRTGGGAVYHDREGELTYSLIFPQDHFDSNIAESYREICEYLVEALKRVNLGCEFKPINDILCNEKKISGNAQTRRQGILLQHGTILFKVDVDKMFSLLKVGKEKIADKLIKSVKKRVTSIQNENSNITFNQLTQAMEDVFSKYYQVEIGEYTKEELEEAKALAESKYKTKEWNEMF